MDFKPIHYSLGSVFAPHSKRSSITDVRSKGGETKKVNSINTDGNCVTWFINERQIRGLRQHNNFSFRYWISWSVDQWIQRSVKYEKKSSFDWERVCSNSTLIKHWIKLVANEVRTVEISSRGKIKMRQVAKTNHHSF